MRIITRHSVDQSTLNFHLFCRLVSLRRAAYLFCVYRGSDIPFTNHQNAKDFLTLYKSIKNHESRKKYDRVRSSGNKGKFKISKLFSFQRAQNKWKLSVNLVFLITRESSKVANDILNQLMAMDQPDHVVKFL